ncbi:MAG: hypothetical protein JJ934_01975 [Pseudomonadales bacterium]|nr:hypothetical protein [Pseudomonadales bacterium]
MNHVGTLTISSPRRIISLFALILFCSFARADYNVIQADGALNITPIESEQALREVQDLLDNNFIDYRVEDSSYRRSLGFIVVTGTYPSKPAAAGDLRSLADAGVKDYLFVARGDYENRISAGVFGTRESAQSRADGLNRRGFSFSVIERFRTLGTRAVVIRDALTTDELERVLTGELLDRSEPSAQTKRPSAQTKRPSAQIEKPSAQIKKPSAEVTEPEGQSAETETEVIDEPNTEPAKPAKPAVVRTQPTQSEDASWLWFLFAGIFLIIAGALTYYYLQRRAGEEAEAAKAPAAKPQEEPKPVSTEDATQIREINVGADPEAFYDYAEAILEGRHGSSRSLAILGTEDTRITELIHDLLLLTRLEEKTEALNTFAFDVRSLIDNLIDRLSLENPKGTAALKSSPSDGLPTMLLMDATKLNRILSIFIQNAIEKTPSGVIDIHQFLDSGQLNTEIRYHPDSKEAREELNAITNPAKSNDAVSMAERIRFGVANRLAAVLGGRIDTAMDKGEALIQVRLPATVAPSARTSLPAGRTIDDLVAGEELAKAEAADARSQIEQAQAEIDRARSEAAENLQNSENAIAELRGELEKARDAQSSELTTAQQQKEEVQQQLQTLNTQLTSVNQELASTKRELKEQVNARDAKEAEAQARVRELETTLEREQARIDQEGKTLRAREDSARAQVEQLEEQLTSMQSAMDSESKKALQVLREHLTEAEQELAGETEARTSAEENARSQVKDLLQQLNGARELAEQATSDRSSLRSQLEETTQALTLARTELEDKAKSLEKASAGAQEKVDDLQVELDAATQAIEKEKLARSRAESNAKEQVSSLEQKLAEAESQRQYDLESNETKIAEANSKIEQLTSRLSETESQLQEQIEAAQDSVLDNEVESLRSELNVARANLENELNRRNNAEASAGKQIEELLDELNLVKSDAKHLSKERAKLENQSQETLNEMETRLQEMEARHKTLKAQADRAEAFGQHQTVLLEQALSDAEGANKLGEAARKVTQHLKAKIKKLESQVGELEARPEPEMVKEPSAEVAEVPQAEAEAPSLRLVPEIELEPSAEIEEPSAEIEAPSAEIDEHEAPVLMLGEEDEEDQEATTKSGIADYEIDDDADFSLDDFGDDTEVKEEPPAEEPLSLVIEELEEQVENLQLAPTGEPPAEEPVKEASSEEQFSFTEASEESEDDEEEDFEYEIQFDDKPIRSARPINNPVLHSMIERFVKQLSHHIDEMEKALASRDYLQLVVSCNWVRGEANTLGFQVLIKPIDSIELQLRREKFSQIITHLSELRNMTERIEIKQSGSPDAPIQYVVPAHAKNAVIYENFVSQLGSKLLELEVAASSDNTRQMTQLCKWINRYGTKIKFVEVVEAANQLQAVIDGGDEAAIAEQLKVFIDIYAKIEIIIEENET